MPVIVEEYGIEPVLPWWQMSKGRKRTGSGVRRIRGSSVMRTTRRIWQTWCTRWTWCTQHQRSFNQRTSRRVLEISWHILIRALKKAKLFGISGITYFDSGIFFTFLWTCWEGDRRVQWKATVFLNPSKRTPKLWRMKWKNNITGPSKGNWGIRMLAVLSKDGSFYNWY